MISKMNYKSAQMLEFPQRGDERGHLVIVEGGIDVPFDVKRIFYIYGSDETVVRGQHANKRTEFVLINVAGILVFICQGWSGRTCMISARILCCYVWQASIMMQRNISAIMRNLWR